jgi:hypothetical protein
MKRGEFLYYDQPNGITIMARVHRIHQDGTVTVERRYAMNKRHPNGTHTYLGNFQRIKQKWLRSTLRPEP